MRAIRTLIVEDEKKAAEGLRAQLARVAPQVAVLALAGSVSEGLELVERLQPELVFLDIELQDGTGFDLLHRQGQVDFGVIFTTAYDHHALQAFRFSAVDYLLKPVNANDLRMAVERFSKMEGALATQSIQTLVQNEAVPIGERKLAVYEANGIRYLRIGEVLRLEAESNYSRLILDNGKSILSTKGLKAYEELLEPMGFFRCHKSFLVNLKQVTRYIKGRKPTLEMKDQVVVAVARHVREELLRKLEALSL